MLPRGYKFRLQNETVLDAIKGDKDLKASALKFVENYNSDEDEKNYDIVHVKEKPKWDCETIISTYSNLYNRPKVGIIVLFVFILITGTF